MTDAPDRTVAPPPTAPDGADEIDRTGAVDRARAFELRGEPPRVMRLSRKALAIMGSIAGLSIGGALLYALQPSTRGVAENLIDTESRSRADAILSAPKDYGEVPKLGAPLPGDLGRPILSAQARGKAVPVPPTGAPGAAPSDPKQAAIEDARRRAGEERDAARLSALFLGAKGVGSVAGTPVADSLALLSGGPPQPAPETMAAPGTPRAFLAESGNRIAVSAERLSAPVSPYVVQAGNIIPAALITGIRSDLPGQITAQVTQNVYDSPTGRFLLIPQGARLIGEYESSVSFGQNRVLLAWDRLILPDGRSLLLDRQPGADAGGRAGLQDRTDYHWDGLIKAALVSALLGVGVELGSDGEGDLVRALRDGSQDTINRAGQQVVQRQLNVRPTLTIRPGHPLRVIVTRDLVLEPIGAR